LRSSHEFLFLPADPGLDFKFEAYPTPIAVLRDSSGGTQLDLPRGLLSRH
jgi:hypothetical protein